MIDEAAFAEYGTEMIVIREIFDGAHELFENELERAFEYGCPTIVIEPCRLGEETARWIFFGEYLTRYSIVTGLSSIAIGLIWPDKYVVQGTLLGSAILAHVAHVVSWQQDICYSYRVEPNPEQYLRVMAAARSPGRFEDNVSLITSATNTTTGCPSAGEETSSEDESDGDDKTEADQEQERQKIRGRRLLPPTNPYEMILSASARKRKSPVVLCRRASGEIRRTSLINAAVSILAIAFQLWKFVRSSWFQCITTTTAKTTNGSSSNVKITTATSSDTFAFLKTLI